MKYNAQVQTTFIKIYKNNSQEKESGQFHVSWKAQKIKNFNHQILK